MIIINQVEYIKKLICVFWGKPHPIGRNLGEIIELKA